MKRSKKKATAPENVDHIQMASPNNRDIKLREKVDRTKLAYIIEHAEAFDIGKSYVQGRIVGGDSQLTLLMDYYRRFESDGCVHTGYVQRNGFGRYWTSTKFGLQNMSRQIRSTIAQGSLWDIDFDNCHPSILLHYCQENNIPCEAVKHYIDNRKEHLADLMAIRGCSRDEAKVAYLEVTNGKVIRKLTSMSDGFVAYYQNMREILTAIVTMRPDLVKISTDNKIKHNKTLYNIEGSVVNLVMTTMENNCLMVMYDLLIEKGVTVASLVFDGLMIEKDESIDVPSLLKECEEAVKKATGVPLKVSRKEMTFSFDMNLEGYIPSVVCKTSPHKAVDALFDKAGSEFVEIQDVSGRQFVGDLDFTDDVKTLAIVSALGTGKTTAICKYIRENNLKRVCVLSPRRTFATSITAEYNAKIPTIDTGFTPHDRFISYLAVKDKRSLRAHDRVVISMESLHLLFDAQPFDLLVVDECQANLTAHICLETNNANLDGNIGVLMDILNNCKKAVFADAFLNNKTINFLHHNRIQTHLQIFDTPMVQRTAIEVESMNNLDGLLFPLIDSLEKGERNYVFVASRNRATKWSGILKEKFPDKTILLYTRDAKEDLSNVNETWGAADVIITTSTITVGINFDKPDWFHNVFISASAKTGNLMSDIFQSHYRVRHLINNRMYFHLATQVNKVLSTNYHFLSNSIDWKENTLVEASTNFSLAPLYVKQLAIDNKFEANVSVSCLRSSFYRYLQACNYSISNPMRVDDDFEFDDGLVEGIDLSFDSIKLLNIIEAREVQLKRSAGSVPLTPDEKAQISKYFFISTFTTNCFLTVDPKVVGKLWKIWIDYGKCRINSIKYEKKIQNNQLTLDALFDNQAETCSIGAIQHSKNIRLRWVLDICKRLGLRHSQDTESIISGSALKDCIQHIKSNGVDLREAFDLRDQRKDKNAPMTEKDHIAIINSVFKHHGFTKMVATGSSQVRVNKVKITNTYRPYKLQAQKSPLDQATGDLPPTCNLVYEHLN